MKLDSALESLDRSSDFLASLSFSHPKAFQNTLLSRVSITSVIRDAEPHESALFTSSGLRKSSFQVPDSGASEVLKSRDASIDVLLGAIDKVCAIYPVNAAQVTGQVELMRHKYGTLMDSVASLERDVESQRRRLDLLSSGREYPNEEDDDAGSQEPIRTQSSLETTHGGLVTEEMIRLEEMEILKLEQLIQEKSRR